MNFNQLIEKVETMIQTTIELGGSRYVKYFLNEEDEQGWTIRVSDHNCNPERIDNKTISLIVPCNTTYSEVVKKFKSVPNQYLLAEDGSFFENFYNVEECLDYNIN